MMMTLLATCCQGTLYVLHPALCLIPALDLSSTLQTVVDPTCSMVDLLEVDERSATASESGSDLLNSFAERLLEMGVFIRQA